MDFILFFLISLVFSLLFFWKKKSDDQLPPGPGGALLLGNGLQFGSEPHIVFGKYVQTYGKMYTIYIGRSPILVLSDAKLMKQLLGNSAATGKFSSEVLRMVFSSGKYGLLVSEGKVWQEQTQFCFRALRQFGFGHPVLMEPKIAQHVSNFCSWLEKKQLEDGKVVVKQKVDEAWSTMLWNMIVGDEKHCIIKKYSNLIIKWPRALQFATKTGLVFFPWLKYLAPNLSGYNGMKNLCKEICALVKNYFDEHKRTRVDGQPARDMIDVYIDKVTSCDDPQSSFYGERGWKHSYACIVQLMLSSADASTLTWVIYYLSVNSKVQRKMQEEIDRVVGNQREPSFTDKATLPYVEAVILETLRYSSLVTVGGIIKLLESVSFEGYILPKGMMILPNFYYVHHDKDVWGDPENFRPERYLEQEHLKEYVVGFKPGKRTCPGQCYSKNWLFLFTAKLFQKYTISTDPDVENVNEYLKPSPGFFLSPNPLPVVATPRAQF